MYRNVGKNIKSYVSLIIVINTLLYAGVGFIIGSILNNPNAVIVLMGVCGITGYLISKFLGAVLYAYGELVESNQRICEILERWQQCENNNG